MVPDSGVSSPKIIRSSVVFPVPLRPTMPTRVSGRKWTEALSNKTLVGYCFVMPSICIMSHDPIWRGNQMGLFLISPMGMCERERKKTPDA